MIDMTVTDEMIEALERELAAAERIEALERQLAAAERDRDKFRRLLEAQQIATMDALRERDEARREENEECAKICECAKAGGEDVGVSATRRLFLWRRDEKGSGMSDIVERLKSGDFYQREGFDAAAAEITALREKLARVERDASVGWLYFNPDTGPEFNEQHPVESGMVCDAEQVRPATAGELLGELIEAWLSMGEHRKAEDNYAREMLDERARANAIQARAERLENALRFYAERMTYTSRTGMECGITKDHFGDRARAALAADGENNDRD